MPEENALMTSMGFDLKPCAQTVDLADTTKFSKLSLTQGQRMQMNALLGEVPSLLASQALAQTYILQFPDGIQHSLVQLAQGGQSSTWLRLRNTASCLFGCVHRDVDCIRPILLGRDQQQDEHDETEFG